MADILNGLQFTNEIVNFEKKIKKLIVIEGPTASGKTSLSIELAKHFSTVIFSADSRQFYRELSIGTAKPNSEEQQGIKHYFIDSHSIFEEFTAASYAKEALAALNKEFLKHEIIIMVGGSGMFIDAVCNGLDSIPASRELRDQLTNQVREEGLENLLIELEQKDPEFYYKVDRKNPLRIIRAIEAIRLSSKTFSEMRKAKKLDHNFTIQRFIIDHPKDQLYERINLRVDQMIENGLLEEVKKLNDYKDLNALKTVGYSEMFSYIDHRIDFKTAVELIKQNTRRYAKRQLTWFRRHLDAVWVKFDTLENMTHKIINQTSKD